MATIAQCIITKSEEDRGAFGVRVDNDENVYFPKSIADALTLTEFETVEAVLVPNNRDDPPWKAIRAQYLTQSGNTQPD